jgi:hypothetical protein
MNSPLGGRAVKRTTSKGRVGTSGSGEGSSTTHDDGVTERRALDHGVLHDYPRL